MEKITLYRSVRPGGGITISPTKPESEYTELYRLIAADGYTLTDGNSTAPCVDTDAPDEWREVQGTEALTQEEKAAAYDEIAAIYEEE